MFKILKSFFGGLLLLGIAFTVFIATGQIPHSKAVTGMELAQSAQKKLVESGIVLESEKIEYYYSEGLTSFVDYGNLFTDMRVISYELDPETNERKIYSANYNEISEFLFERAESVLEDSVIQVYESGEFSFALLVSDEEGGDEKFYRKLVETWNAKMDDENIVNASLQDS